MLLDDQLATYEAFARAACAGLADRITSREMGLHAPTQGATWLDIAILEAEMRGDPRQRAEVVVTTTISVSVRHTNVAYAKRLERWIEGEAHRRITQLDDLRQLYAKLEPGQINDVASDISGTIVVYTSRTIRSILGNFKMQAPAVLGLTTRTDGGTSTPEGNESGRARDVFAGRMVSWVSPGVALGPLVGNVIYAGAQVGDQIDILDAAGGVVESLPLATVPTGTVATSSLAAGDYNARLVDVTTARPLEVTTRPVEPA